MNATPDRAPSPSRSSGGARTTPDRADEGHARSGQTRGPSEPGGEHGSPLCSAEGPRPKRRNKSGAIGTATETAVVRYLRANGFEQAERRRLKGAHDEGDITGTPGIVWEIKGGQTAKHASDALIREWLGDTEIERQNAGADLGILVVQRAGIGPANAGRWWAIVPYVTAYCLHTGDDVHVQPGAWDALDAIPVRLRLGDLVDLLRHAGFGTPYGQVTQ